jgi:hypothetical protein
MQNDLQAQIDKLRIDLAELRAEVYSNNFSASQDFNKYCRFNTRMKIPRVASNPTVGEVDDIVSVNGIVKICTVASLTAPTWVTVGTQT